MEKKLAPLRYPDEPWSEAIAREILREYWDGGLPEVEKALLEMMEAT
jgi:hypothetical protein